MNKEEDIEFIEADDLFFEVEKPKDVSYTYRIRIGKIGSFFVTKTFIIFELAFLNLFLTIIEQYFKRH